MVVAFSSHGESGGTLHLPSPTHVRHSDPSHAIAQLRRSLSRSPSKGPSFRLVTSKSTSPSPKSPLSPSPLSPSRRNNTVPSPSPLAVPVPSSAKKSRSVIRRSSPMRVPVHLVRSPARRALNECSDHGNAATPPSSIGSSSGTENEATDSEMDKPESTVPESNLPEVPSNPNRVFARRANSSYLNDIAAKSSPLKRSDGSRSFDLAHVGSPSAKRRSLHGASFGPDFDIFDQFSASELQAATPSEPSVSLDFGQNPSQMPKRTSSLRKTTLQQRQDKPSVRPRPEFGTFPDFSSPSQNRSRARLSLDQFPQPARDSPFSSQGALPNASVHPPRKVQAQIGNLAMSQRHPLSRTLTQSSSGSSMAEDSPTHAPVKHPDFRRPNVFARSLPLGSNKPTASSENESSQESGAFSTPDNYKLAKPLPSAFMSTGLISKRNKNIDNPSGLNESIGHMPDTPCKRPTSLATMSPFPKPSANNMPRQSRHTMHSFGTPSTPFNPHVSRRGSTLGKETNIFGSTFNHTRRGSFLSDTEENANSNNSQTQSSNEYDIPPTPTKQNGPADSLNFGRSLHRSDSLFGFRASVDSSKVERFQGQNANGKSSIFIIEKGAAVEEGGGNVADGSPSAQLRFRSVKSIPSFSNRFNDRVQGRSPSRHIRKALPLPFIRVTKDIKANSSLLSPASPHLDRSASKSPRTPSETMVPPDPSGLSISARAEALNQSTNFASSLNSLAPPATPTANRDSFLFGANASVTPMHHAATAEIDESLTSRFDKTELIGAGEFSQVFRVSMQGPSAYDMALDTQGNASTVTQAPGQVWAVKKTRGTYLGERDRQRKLQEVKILKDLGHSEHTIEFIDSWEHHRRLYIQTEFCEEGSLDLFLDQAGRKARLDDFRIWKIMLELSQGLKHIHDSGIIHLDLKPANVFITFEGTLKIGDFGMATTWPAQAGIEGEGDREYIGPEILMGKYDKPADIFALGLIMLEIAGNVMLPENGVSWQRLRAGDMSDVPSLTSSSLSTAISRDSSGIPLTQQESFEKIYLVDSENGGEDLSDLDFLVTAGESSKSARSQPIRAGELQLPPSYMIDPNNEQALDKIVRWMISPDPADRPVADQLIRTDGVAWVNSRRRAGATIYEGNWGPADEVLQDDAEMVDV